MTTTRMFEVERIHHERSEDLRLAIRPPTCEQGHPETRLRAIQPALFRHAGYGAAEMSEWRVCVMCPSVRLRQIIEVNPRRIEETMAG